MRIKEQGTHLTLNEHHDDDNDDELFYKNRTVYEIMWKSIVAVDRPQITIWRMSFACWIPKAINTHSEYAILITFTGNNVCIKVPHFYIIYT